MPVDTVVTGGRVVSPTGIREASVAVDDGEIVSVGREDSLPTAEERVDADGLLVMPGVIDVHVHIDDMFSIDTYETATAAGALGGVTTYIDFAWQPWEGDFSIFDEAGPLSEGIESKKAKGEGAYIDYGLHGVITREDPAVFDEIESVVDEGVTSIKLFTAYEFGLSYGFMERAFEAIADVDAFAIMHTEEASVCDERTERLQAEGRGDPPSYPESRPDHAEAAALDTALRLAQAQDAKYYGLHTTSRVAAEVIERFREDGSRVRGETCTHYTTLDDSVFEEQGNLPMLAPPIRKPDDNEAMFEHLRDGTLDVVSTDHCGYTEESKVDVPWWDSKFGANALQTSLPVFHDEAVNERGFSYPFLVQVMCTNPARTFGMPWKGTLEPGTDADLILFDPDREYTIDPADNASKADFSIYEGREVQGMPVRTMVRGEWVAVDGEIVGDSGHGEFVERDRPDWDR
jgi:dihydropyrimidinase